MFSYAGPDWNSVPFAPHRLLYAASRNLVMKLLKTKTLFNRIKLFLYGCGKFWRVNGWGDVSETVPRQRPVTERPAGDLYSIGSSVLRGAHQSLVGPCHLRRSLRRKQTAQRVRRCQLGLASSWRQLRMNPCHVGGAMDGEYCFKDDVKGSGPSMAPRIFRGGPRREDGNKKVHWEENNDNELDWPVHQLGGLATGCTPLRSGYDRHVSLLKRFLVRKAAIFLETWRTCSVGPGLGHSSPDDSTVGSSATLAPANRNRPISCKSRGPDWFYVADWQSQPSVSALEWGLASKNQKRIRRAAQRERERRGRGEDNRRKKRRKKKRERDLNLEERSNFWGWFWQELLDFW